MGGKMSCTLNNNSATVEFSPTSFASGEYRRAHHATYTSGPKSGRSCVVKTYKAQRYAAFADDIKIAKIAKSIATEFNNSRKGKRQVTFIIPQLGKINRASCFNALCCGDHVGDAVTVEDFIPGEYEKFVSNNGTLKFHGTLSSFTHYSYWCSKQRLIIVDLQGVRTTKGYTLTDPAIHSTETMGHGYGELDLGTVGIEAFFSTHKCEKACRDLPKPNKARYTFLDCEDIIKRKKRNQYVVIGES
tara:strand:- start:67 stop:801 length:735 start_codon:yes stop_codon:yes gene_type:complete